MDSLDWSKKYEGPQCQQIRPERVWFIHRTDQSTLTDEDMEQIAEEPYHRYDLNDFGEDVLFVARLVLAEKE